MPTVNSPFETFEIYKKEALAGNAESAFVVGECYEYGSPVERNINEAIHWYRIARDLGDRRAKTSLERLAWEGYSVDPKADAGSSGENNQAARDTIEEGAPMEVDQRGDRKLFVNAKRLAKIGDADNEYLLGIYYMQGSGVKQNEKKGVKWLKKAAKQGVEEAEYQVGICYESGKGVRQNDKKAFKWFKKAALKGFVDAEAKYGIYLAEGKGVKKNPKLAEVWLSKAAGNGNAEAGEALRVLSSAKYADSVEEFKPAEE